MYPTMLACRSQSMLETHVDHAHVLRAHPELELPKGLHEGRALDVPHGAPQLYDAHLGAAPRAVHGDRPHALDPVLDSVRHVRTARCWTRRGWRRSGGGTTWGRRSRWC